MMSAKAILGLTMTAIALTGGAVASYLNIRNARGPKEKHFVTRVCVAAWLVILSMLALVYVLPPPWRYYTAIGYFLICPWLVYKWATTHQLIRMLEQREAEEAHKK